MSEADGCAAAVDVSAAGGMALPDWIAEEETAGETALLVWAVEEEDAMSGLAVCCEDDDSADGAADEAADEVATDGLVAVARTDLSADSNAGKSVKDPVASS